MTVYCIGVWDFPRVLNAGEILELENDPTLCLTNKYVGFAIGTLWSMMLLIVEAEALATKSTLHTVVLCRDIKHGLEGTRWMW